ncbi:sensor histidine kinase [Nitriliruptor alkaliphilus]|uniref:sensor histidine kinase n=1 Tax=Nitriliruptor alkaliphilus TaxID=427918 RepID=UPI0012EE9367|nr:ATP-binding protein [Nitriliruptor alkaliphilus]
MRKVHRPLGPPSEAEFDLPVRRIADTVAGIRAVAVLLTLWQGDWQGRYVPLLLVVGWGYAGANLAFVLRPRRAGATDLRRFRLWLPTEVALLLTVLAVAMLVSSPRHLFTSGGDAFFMMIPHTAIFWLAGWRARRAGAVLIMASPLLLAAMALLNGFPASELPWGLIGQRSAWAAAVFVSVLWFIGRFERAFDELLRMNDELVRSRMREQAARDVHDLTLSRLSSILESARSASSNDEIAATVGDIANAEYRRLRAWLEGQSSGWQPFAVELQELVLRWDQACPGMQITFSPMPTPPVTDLVALEAVAVVELALSNVLQHASATRCVVSLSEEEGWVVLRIRDDGVGVGPDASDGNGLVNGRARIEGVGGSFAIGPDLTGSGSVVTVKLPPERVGAAMP